MTDYTRCCKQLLKWNRLVLGNKIIAIKLKGGGDGGVKKEPETSDKIGVWI